jgi:3-deoxy-D-manno-octulosonate 8-phosphate phosphatase KdsC-like HAD superfamily phosphatase
LAFEDIDMAMDHKMFHTRTGVAINEMKDSGIRIPCVICRKSMYEIRGRRFAICDDCLSVLAEVVKERLAAKARL